MKRFRSTRIVLAGLAVLAAAACGDSTRSTLTPEAPSLASGSLAKVQKAADRAEPITRTLTRSVDVSYDRAGRIEIDEAGFRLDIPKGAIRRSDGTVRISVTVLPGKQLAYEFQPSGITFQRPLEFEQDLRDISVDARLLAFLAPKVSYFKSTADLDRVNGVVRTYEDLLTDLDLSGHKLKADIWHFSGYIVSWGFR